jgi:hypothetical protein
MLVSAFLVWASIAGLEARAIFDLRRRTLTTASWAPHYSLSNLRAVRVETPEWSEDLPSCSMQVETLEGRSFRLMGEHDQSEVGAVQSQSARCLSPTDPRGRPSLSGRVGCGAGGQPRNRLRFPRLPAS